jgi:16S rRNA (guanine527-N7)-methyltransferase
VAEETKEMQIAEIQAIGREVGQEIGREVAGQVAAFARLFLKWNARINLSGARDAGELLYRHFKDAFAACRFIGERARVVDVGSGGGLPAVPMALIRATAGYDLYEPIAKKVAFLRTAARELALGERVRVHPRRLDLPVSGEARGVFDVALSQATLPPPTWLALGRELVRPGGRVLVFGTAALPEGCPPASEEFRYGENRVLFAFDT